MTTRKTLKKECTGHCIMRSCGRMIFDEQKICEVCRK